MIKNIIFDWSGVIKDSVEDHRFAVNKIFEQFGLPPMSLEELKENWIQPHMLFYNKYIPDLTTDQQTIIYKQAIMTREPRVYGEIVRLIRDLYLKGFKMVVLSSDLLETVLPELISFGLTDFFLEVLPNTYNKIEGADNLMKKYNFDNLETLIIGDSNYEIEVGKVLKIKTIATTWGFASEKQLIAAQPDFIVHNIKELESIFLPK